MSRRKRRIVLRDRIGVAGEAERIIRKAQERDARVVTLGNTAFFSTDTGISSYGACPGWMHLRCFFPSRA